MGQGEIMGYTLVDEPKKKASNGYTLVDDADTGPDFSSMGPESEPSLMGRVADVFTGKSRETAETGRLPEFRQTEEIQKFAPRGVKNQLKLTAGLMTSFSPQAQMDVISEAIPEAFFEEDEKGNIIVDVNGKRSILNKPGWSGQDTVTALTNVLANIPSAKLTTLGKTVLKKVGLGAVGSGATEDVLQRVERGAGSKEEYNPLRTAMSTVLGGAAETIAPMIKGVKALRKAAKQPFQADEIFDTGPEMAKAKRAESVTGVELFPAQKTGIPSQLETQSFYGQLPAAGKKSFSALKKQNEQVARSVDKFLSDISPPSAVSTGPKKFKTASEDAIKKLEETRKMQTDPLYKEAMNDNTIIDTFDIRKQISKDIQDYAPNGKMAQELKSIRRLLTKSEKEVAGKRQAGFITKAQTGEELKKQTGLTLKQLQTAKWELYNKIKGPQASSFQKDELRQLTKIYDNLNAKLHAISPKYKQADELFTKLSKPIDEISDTVIGQASRLNETSLKDLAGKVFNPKETNLEVMKNAKKTIQSTDPEAWNQLLRVELEGRIGKVKGAMDAGDMTIENLPAKLHSAIFGNYKQSKLLYRALDKQAAQNAYWLETMLKRASLGRPGGSQTGIRKEISENLDKGVLSALFSFAKHPIATTAEAVTTGATKTARDTKIKSFAEMIYNPKWQPELAKITKMNPKSEQAKRAMTQLLGRISTSNKSRREGETQE